MLTLLLVSELTWLWFQSASWINYFKYVSKVKLQNIYIVYIQFNKFNWFCPPNIDVKQLYPTFRMNWKDVMITERNVVTISMSISLDQNAVRQGKPSCNLKISKSFKHFTHWSSWDSCFEKVFMTYSLKMLLIRHPCWCMQLELEEIEESCALAT